jgi:hypothetical protein
VILPTTPKETEKKYHFLQNLGLNTILKINAKNLEELSKGEAW